MSVKTAAGTKTATLLNSICECIASSVEATSSEAVEYQLDHLPSTIIVPSLISMGPANF